MNPLILNKEKQDGNRRIDGSWLTQAKQRCRAAQMYIEAESPTQVCDDLRTLVYDDVPALLRKLEQSVPLTH